MLGIKDGVEGEEGFSLAVRLSAPELETLEQAVRAKYMSNIRARAPSEAEWFETRSVGDYHLGQDKVQHDKIWNKASRIFDSATVETIKSLPFMNRLREEFGPFAISGESGLQEEEIYWRLVRPGKKEDVGPVHADQWFWALGNGETPEGVERVKIWIAVMTEPGRNGLQVVPGSHRRDWQWHGESRDGIMKPVFDEDPATIGLHLPEFTPGQAIVFNDRLLHAGAVNGGRKTRVSMEFTLFTRPAQRMHVKH